MASLTIRNIDDDLKRKLQVRAARNGRSMEQDCGWHCRTSWRRSESRDCGARRGQGHLRATPCTGQPPLEPIDQKAVSDELYDYLP